MSVPKAAPRVRAVVLAAGAGRRFGGQKLLADLGGRPVLQHVLDALAAAGADDPVVVIRDPLRGPPQPLDWRRAECIVNPDPERGLASSLLLGWAAGIDAGAEAVLVVLGDQPRVRPALIQTMLEMPLDAARPIVAARYSATGARNPVRVEATAAAHVRKVTGDRGLGPLLDRRPELVRTIDVDGDNPDLDVPEDLAAFGRPDRSLP